MKDNKINSALDGAYINTFFAKILQNPAITTLQLSELLRHMVRLTSNAKNLDMRIIDQLFDLFYQRKDASFVDRLRVAHGLSFLHKSIPEHLTQAITTAPERPSPNPDQMELALKLAKQGDTITEKFVEGWFVDLFIENKKVIIELDGDDHYGLNGELRPQDIERDELLVSKGYRIIRLSYYYLHDRSELCRKINNFMAGRENYMIVDCRADSRLAEQKKRPRAPTKGSGAMYAPVSSSSSSSAGAPSPDSAPAVPALSASSQ